MVYKWCVVPQCTNTSINSPHKLFVSVPTNAKRRNMWLKLSQRDPKSILSHTNVFMCEDHFDMEKDTINYMKYKMGFSKKILLADEAMPTKFHCQEDRKRGLSDAGCSRKVIIKRQRVNHVTECLQSKSATETHPESVQKGMQGIIEPEEIPKSQEKETITNSVQKSVQVTTKEKMHFRCKTVQTRFQRKSISTSPMKVSTTSRFNSPFKIEPWHLQQPSHSGAVKVVKRNIVSEDEKSDSDISCFESCHISPFAAISSSSVTDSNSNITDNTENHLQQLSHLGAVKVVKRNIVFEDEKSDSDISCFESCQLSPFASLSSSSITDSASSITDNNENRLQQPSHLGAVKVVKRNVVFEDEKSDYYISCFERCQLSPFEAVSSSRVTDSDSNVTDNNENIQQLQCLKNTMLLIDKKPLMYVGISKECYFLIQLLHKHTNIKIEHILLCLKKIRLNNTFSELEDNFGISSSYASKLFLRSIPIISTILRPFIVNLDQKLIKKNLPIAFRHNYHNVSCIIDCLEINIQKPSKALYQALTWSEYKKGNTVKYLISCTPNGLVNYVSPGFGGRTSDVTIVENCNFLSGLKQGTCILVDRGFKHLEHILHEKGVKLLRLPTVNTGVKLSKTEVRQTKIIASMRIHIEGVIRRLREFHMLKQHSVINTNILCVLDHVIVIACALINLQDSFIK